MLAPSLVRISAVLLFFAVVSALGQKVTVLDLTKPARYPYKPRTFTAQGGGILGHGDRPQQRGRELPLRIKVESLGDRAEDTRFVLVVLLVTNVGDKNFCLPASRDVGRVHKDGNKDRRTMLFSLRLAPPFEQSERFGLDSTYSSASALGSSICLSPGDSVRVRLRADLLMLPEAWRSNNAESVQLQAVLEEWVFDDKTSEYFRKEASEEAISENIVTMKLR